MTVISALPLAVISAWLVAVSETVAGCGCADGATYCTAVSEPVGAMHGFEFGVHT